MTPKIGSFKPTSGLRYLNLYKKFIEREEVGEGA
jgi:hypothetical protein